MEIYDIADEIQRLCRKIIATDHPAELEQQCARLRALLREHTRRTHDQAAQLLVQILDTEYRLKHAS
jgi:predicted oxidoreductase (fatty acid repression mutant protein)